MDRVLWITVEKAFAEYCVRRSKIVCMLTKTIFRAAFTATLCLAAGSTSSLWAQGRSAAQDPVAKIRLLKPNLYMITGGGANTLVRVTPDGLIVVDTKNPGENRYDRVMEEIRSVTDKPVKYVLNTHHHPDHVGNNKQFIDAGATVIGLEALKADMASDPRTKDIPGLPTQTFAKDYVLKLGGAEVDAHAFGRGHTGDDTMIYFPDLKVVMVSDQISDGTPGIGVGTGGSLLEWNKELDGVLALDFDTAIPGRGEPKTRADVQAYRTKMATLIDRVTAAIKAGATRETLASKVDTTDLGWKFNPRFFGGAYDEITKNGAGKN
ncbi:MAG TPA: MBL fold metallo-hydrolase [Bryobacteraceae bacterium]|nr:MBL fold metallo-hydrolase [Bryobacteraceae bacterium]